MFHVPEKFRVTHGELASSAADGNNGAFLIKSLKVPPLWTICSDGFVDEDPSKLCWEHVSVSVMGKKRCPTWEEMCHVKNLFWDEEDCVIQYHPPKSQYVNNHAYCLHLWRPVGVVLPMPQRIMVGI